MNVHISRGVNKHYRIRTKFRGSRTWCADNGRYKECASAAKMLAQLMAMDFNIKRGEVLLCADYYDPTPILRMVRP